MLVLAGTMENFALDADGALVESLVFFFALYGGGCFLRRIVLYLLPGIVAESVENTQKTLIFLTPM